MFNKGLFPAINIQLSVSRTGSSVQSKLIRKVSKGLKAQHAVLHEIKKFADLSIDISDSLVTKMKQWDGINTLLVQHGYDGYTRQQIAILIYLFELKYLNDLKDKRTFSKLFKYLCKNNSAAKSVLEKISENNFKLRSKDIKNEIEFIFGSLAKAIEGHFGGWISAKDLEKMKGAANV